MKITHLRTLLSRSAIAGALMLAPLAAITWADEPDVLLLEPSSAPNTEAVMVAIVGTDFLEADVPHLARPDRPDIEATGTIITPAAILATFDIANEAPGPWDLVITNPEGVQTCDDCFTVTASAPTGPTVTPESTTPGTSGLELSLRGTNLFPGARATFSNTGITPTSTTYIDTTELLVTVDVAGGAPRGAGGITITNTDGQSSSCGGCFRVLSTPAIATVAPGLLGQGATSRQLSVVGSDFSPGATVSFSGGGITMNGLSYHGPGELRPTISVGSAAALGGRDVTVTNPDGVAVVCPACLTVVPAPAVTTVSPATGGQGAAARTVSVSGPGVSDTSSVAFGDGIEVLSTTGAAGAFDAILRIGSDAVAGPRDITIVNPDGGTTVCGGCFAVTPAPRVAGVSPDRRGRGAQDHEVTLSGSGFVEGTSLVFSGAGISADTLGIVDDEEMLAVIDIDPDAIEGTRSLTVTNPDGGTSSCEACFTIDAGPLLRSVTPGQAPQGAPAVLTLDGERFAPTATVSFSDPGITIDTLTIQDGTAASIDVRIAPDATAGPVDVTIDNHDGSSPAVCSACFSIVPGPGFASVTPPSRGQGALDQAVTILGSGFEDGVTVEFSGPGITVEQLTRISRTELALVIDVNAASPAGARDVILTNPGTVPVTCEGCFTINQAPTVAAADPGSRGPGVTGQRISIAGSDFLQGATVAFGGTGIAVTGVSLVDAGELLATIDVAPGAEPGARDIVVSNADGGPPATCGACFAIASGPGVTAISPAGRGQGAHGEPVTLFGSGFDQGATPTIDGGGIAIGEVTVVDATQIRMVIDVAADAWAAARDVLVTNPDGSTAGTCTACFLVTRGPSIGSISPPVRGQGATGQTIAVGGANFLEGAQVAFSGTGITVRDTGFRNDGLLEVRVDIAPMAPTGRRSITVTNPDGATPAVCLGCFSISALGRVADFNGDGFADLAVGAPGDRVGGRLGAGTVSVLYGSARSLTADGDQIWHRDTAGVLDAARAGDAFGLVLAMADFDGDGYSDLAVGAPGDRVGGKFGAGSVSILYGSSSGLTAAGDQVWHRDSAGVAGVTRRDAAFGAALVAGDFDADGFADLAVGAPGDDGERGSVSVLYGSGSGLRAKGSRLWHRNSRGVPGTGAAGEGFGAALATGDFDANGTSDLAIGAPGTRVSGYRDAGSIVLLEGTQNGLVAVPTQLHRDVRDMRGASRRGAGFGAALAAGDFNGDGYDDLGAGAPGDRVHHHPGAGSINAIYGSASGLRVAGNQLWRRDMGGVRGGSGTGDAFGAVLVAGDFDGDGRSDLAIGVPGDGLSGKKAAGSVNVLYGSAAKLRGGNSQLWHRDVSGVLGRSSTGGLFGAALSVDDFNGDGRSDLVIGSPGDDIGTRLDAGAVNVLAGSAGKLTAAGDQLWHKDVAGILGSAAAAASFGCLAL